MRRLDARRRITLWAACAWTLGCCLSHAFAQSDNREASASDPSRWRLAALQRAAEVAALIADPYRRAEAFASIAKAQVEVGDTPHGSVKEALGAAAKVEQAEFKGWALHEIVLAQIAAGDLIAARQSLGLISADRPHGAASIAIAQLQLHGNDVEAARNTAMDTRHIESQGEILRQIAAMQAARGQIDAALISADRIRDAFYRSIAFGDIAVAEVRRGNLERAHEAARSARRSYRPQIYGRIVMERLDRGDVSGALETLAKVDDDLYRAALQGRIATAPDAGAQLENAAQMFAAAVQTAAEAPDKSPRKGIVLSQLARMQAMAGAAGAAGEILRQASRAAAALPAGPERDVALEAVARGLMRADDTTGALSTAGLIGDAALRVLLVRDIVMRGFEDASEAVAALRSAGLGEPLAETAALFGVLGAQVMRSGRVRSLDTIDAARDAVRSIRESQLKPAAFSALAAARVAAGDASGGWAIFEEALAAAEQIDRPEQRAAAYVRIVSALDDRLMFLGRPARDAQQAEEN